MKCPKCGGEGKYFKKEKGNSCYVVSLSFCDMCHGSGEVEMTNEEWLKQCDTEQLADVLADVSLWIHPFMKQKNRFELLKKQFYVWLKQPHQ